MNFLDVTLNLENSHCPYLKNKKKYLMSTQNPIIPVHNLTLAKITRIKIITVIGKRRNTQELNQTIQGGTNTFRVETRNAILTKRRTKYYHQKELEKKYNMIQSSIQCKWLVDISTSQQVP